FSQIVGGAVRTFFSVGQKICARSAPYKSELHAQLPARLHPGWNVLLHRRHRTTCPNSLPRTCSQAPRQCPPRVPPAMAVSDRRSRPPARPSARDLDFAAWRCRLFETLGLDQEGILQSLAIDRRHRASDQRVEDATPAEGSLAAPLLGTFGEGRERLRTTL